MNGLLQELKKNVAIRQVGIIEKLGDELTYLSRTVRRIPGGYELEGNWSLVEKLAEQLHLQDSKPVATPGTRYSAQQEQDASMLVGANVSQFRSAVGSLMYVATDQPEVQQAAAAAARGMQSPTMLDQWRLKRAVRYLIGRGPVAAVYTLSEVPDVLETHVDSDWAGDIRSRRSTSGGLIRLAGAWIQSWSRLQSVTALSSAEAEYYALTTGLQESRAIQSTLAEIGYEVTIALYSDSSTARQSAEKVGLLHVKHLSLKMHFLKEAVQAGLAKIYRVKGTENPADMWTKAVPVSIVTKCLAIAGCWRQRRQEHETIIVEDVCESAVALKSAVAPEGASSSVRGGAASSATQVPSAAHGFMVPTRSGRTPRANSEMRFV